MYYRRFILKQNTNRLFESRIHIVFCIMNCELENKRVSSGDILSLAKMKQRCFENDLFELERHFETLCERKCIH